MAKKKGTKAAAKSSTKKPAASAAKKGGKRLVASKHENIRIGLQKKSRPPRVFVADDATNNVFLIFGDSIGTDPVNRKRVRLASSHHTWTVPSRLRNQGSDALEITARCRVTVAATRGHYTDDDLTVTLTLDPGTIGEDTTECEFNDVEYDQ